MSQVFNITEKELCDELDLSRFELDELVSFFDSDPEDEWDLIENQDFIFSNRTLKERKFSLSGAHKIVRYIIKMRKSKSFWKRINPFFGKKEQTAIKSFIRKRSREELAKPGALVRLYNRQFIQKGKVIKMLATNGAKFKEAFSKLQNSKMPLIEGEDFIDVEGVRYFSLSGLERISNYLANNLSQKHRREYCDLAFGQIQKVALQLADEESQIEKRIRSTMDTVKRKDKKTCQITGRSRSKLDKGNICVHHIFSKEHFPHLAAVAENMITLSEEVHQEFHIWNGGFDKPCTADKLIEFIHQMYPDRDDCVPRIKNSKNVLGL